MLLDLVHSPSLVPIIGDWVTKQTSDNGEYGFAGEYNALGVIEKNKLIAGFCFHDWHSINKTIAMTAAAASPRWATRRIIEGILSYPFLELGVQRIGAMIKADNFASLRLAEGVGFKREARLERAAGMNTDIILLRLFVEEWQQGKFYGRKSHGNAKNSQAA